ncbi:MAG TPA: hypothetical protein VGU69_16020 [Rhizomicrobium sp.]|nr:hypothetical protein [Rhizomicrobium sp.]
MSTSTVQTVLGAIKIEDLGRTLVHEHLIASFPGVEFDAFHPFDRAAFVKKAVQRLRALKDHGVRSFVDPCPIELGRDVELFAEVSEKSEIHIICTTGFYFEAWGLPVYWRMRTAEEIAELYIREIEKGCGQTRIRAGAIKCATDAKATPLEEKFLAAACIAQRATGVPIITHTQDGLGGPEQQRLFRSGGVEAHRCLIGHCCGNPDPAYHRQIVEGGTYIGFDRVGKLQFQSDDLRADNLVRLVRAGFGAQVLVSQDAYCEMLGRYHPVRQLPAAEIERVMEEKRLGLWPQPYTYLFDSFVPRLRARGLAEAEISQILDDNPRRFLAGEPFAARA